METKVALKYRGPAVDSGLMDVYEASANMIAFSDFVLLTAKTAYGERVEVRAEVAGFGKGSFVTDLVFNVAGASATILASVDPRALWDLLKESIEFWKFLEGTPPTKVDHSQSAVNTATVTNNSGEVRQVSINTLNVVFSDKGVESAERFIHKALGKPGMDAVEIATSRGLLERVNQNESGYFVQVAPSRTVTDVTVRMVLIVESAVFKEDNKWRFSDGGQSFYALIEDREFLARVDAGEAFRKGDVIVADVRISQEQAGMKLTSERYIVRVYEHREAAVQLTL